MFGKILKNIYIHKDICVRILLSSRNPRTNIALHLAVFIYIFIKMRITHKYTKPATKRIAPPCAHAEIPNYIACHHRIIYFDDSKMTLSFRMCICGVQIKQNKQINNKYIESEGGAGKTTAAGSRTRLVPGPDAIAYGK